MQRSIPRSYESKPLLPISRFLTALLPERLTASRLRLQFARRRRLQVGVVSSVVFWAMGAVAACAQTPETILHTFNAYADGANPQAPLIQAVDGDYYGTTYAGGTSYNGTLFRFSPATHLLTTIYSFNGAGASPRGGVIQGRDGTLYGTTSFGGARYAGTVYRINTDGSGFTVLHSFQSSTDGSSPAAGVIQGSDGSLYGTTQSGGSGNAGTVFQLSTDGSAFKVLHNFASATDGGSPSAGVIQGVDGNLYGTTPWGGTGNSGTLYEVGIATSSFTVLHSFTGGADGGDAAGGVIQGKDGRLYGLNASGGAGAGVAFGLNTDGSTFKVLHAFKSATDGSYAGAGVVQGSDGNLYGTTLRGGAYGGGTAFRLSPTGGGFKILHSFNPVSEGYSSVGNLVQGNDGLFHGSAFGGPTGRFFSNPRPIGTLFSINSTGSSFHTDYRFSNGVVDGIQPRYGSLASDGSGNYYGTTYQGGGFDNGTLYSIASNGDVTLLHSFQYAQGIPGGAYPDGGVTLDHGILYGTTYFGGPNNTGTIYSYDLYSHKMTTLYQFGAAYTTGGYHPASAPIKIGGSLYGTLAASGQYGFGAIYEYTLPTSSAPGALQLLHSFAGLPNDGSGPMSPLILGQDGSLYGTTQYGGANGHGCVFKITLAGALTLLHSFSYNVDGAQPLAGVIQGRDGMLYGTTSLAGPQGYGVVFQLSTNGAAFKLLHSFTASGDGGGPQGGVIQASDGLLYGGTAAGGANGTGAVYRVATDGSAYSLLYSFGPTGTDGSSPAASLVEGVDGNLYGTTVNGGLPDSNPTAIAGTVFRLATQLPLISKFTPGAGPVGTTVTLTGANLAGASVTIHGVAQSVVSTSASTVVFQVAIGTTTGPLQVTTSNGAVTAAKSFVVTH